MSRSAATALLGTALALTGRSARACAVCVGDSSADMTQGMIIGILAMLVVTGSVLGLLGYFFIRIMQRTRAIARAS